MNALVEQTSFGLTTNSRTVAEVFEKEHKNVLRDIDVILQRRPDLLGLKFEPMQIEVSTSNGASRLVRAFEMNRDGFTLLAMGFTGDAALDWKLTFIDAINRMEAEITRQGALDEPEPDDEASGSALPVVAGEGTPTMLEIADFGPALSMIRETRLLFGRAAAQRMWPKLGLPEIGSEASVRRGEAELAGYVVPDSLTEWLEECCVQAPEAREMADDLYTSYQQWCAEGRHVAETQTSFGRTLSRLGFPPKRLGRVWRTGLKLLR